MHYVAHTLDALRRNHDTQQHSQKATNLTLSADVLAEAKTLNMNISQACDRYLRELVRSERESRWRQEHAEFISAYNQILEQDGLPLDKFRIF
ncbi:type II toxin-antitoxin system CcdA family antitoxin [Methylomonas sp. UP202]|uniref:type II toxin-antitoxin system CcdA family antitoxin n=1 Tax=Methylomonas sp. UP202 TaxID=3040943 RepID=UPI0024795CDF|nr:type II toxin-antitoxin system CcdA family antitoxin [Methylomonas sp. UP202]WGS87009.1 type II toxin-antitoxin system CcdA family antitoxin [Methylomonas sp. UP202]